MGQHFMQLFSRLNANTHYQSLSGSKFDIFIRFETLSIFNPSVHFASQMYSDSTEMAFHLKDIRFLKMDSLKLKNMQFALIYFC